MGWDLECLYNYIIFFFVGMPSGSGEEHNCGDGGSHPIVQKCPYV